MRRMPIAKAAEHFSELVELAEHEGQRILVCRNGRPVAAIVPVSVVEASKPSAIRREATDHETVLLLAGLGAPDLPRSDVSDLLDE